MKELVERLFSKKLLFAVVVVTVDGAYSVLAHDAAFPDRLRWYLGLYLGSQAPVDVVKVVRAKAAAAPATLAA